MHRPQFSVRALLVLMVVVAVFFGGIHRGIHIGRQRQKADDEAAAAVAAEQAELLARIGNFQIHLDGEFLQHLAEMQKPSEEAAE